MDKITKTLENTGVKSIDEETRTIWHKVSVENKDLMGDIVRIDGIDTSKFKKKPGVIYGHHYAGIDPVPVIAENVGFKKEGKALYAGTKFLNTDGLSQKLKDLINDLWILNKKKLMGWSIGFQPVETEELKDKDGENTGGYDFKKSLLLEYSNVIIPANQDAINDAISKGIVSKNLKESLKDIQDEDEVTDKEIGEIGSDDDEEEKEKTLQDDGDEPKETGAEIETPTSKKESTQSQDVLTSDLINELREVLEAYKSLQEAMTRFLELLTNTKTEVNKRWNQK